MALELVAFAMAAAGFVETALNTWDAVQRKYQAHKASKSLARDLVSFGNEDRRSDLKTDLELAQTIVRDRNTSKETRDRLARDFSDLSQTLESLPVAVDAVIANIGLGIHKIPQKLAADKELRSKASTFDQKSAKFHQTVMSLRAVTQSKSSLQLEAVDLRIIGLESNAVKLTGAIFATKASYSQPGQASETIDVLLERKWYKSETKNELEQSMKVLANCLSKAHPAWNILHLRGYRENHQEKAFELVFDRPSPQKELISLGAVYLSTASEPSLNVRIGLCSKLATAVLQAHKIGLVHKNIRPDNLLVSISKDAEGNVDDAALFLVGWQAARMIDGTATTRLGESSVWTAIYQHPDRRTDKDAAKEDYNIGHDIYSLGVCTLELLTWSPLIRPEQHGRARRPALSDAYMAAFKHLGYHTGVQTFEGDDITLAELYTRDGPKTHATLLRMAKTVVPPRAGRSMADLVNMCLDYSLNTSQTGSDVSARFDAEIFDKFNKILSVI